MTRINLVPPEILCDQHLIAEYRELPRIGTLLRKTVEAKRTIVVPKQFCLGPGHMKFFLDKGRFLHDRFTQLRIEMILRGFNPKLHFRNDWQIRPDLYGDYAPRFRDVLLSVKRITQCMPKQPRFTKLS